MSAGSGASGRANRDLTLLAPAFRRAVEKAIAECNAPANGFDAMVYEAYRSAELQRIYYARGRTAIPPHHTVTNASTNLYSWHGYGLAVDVVHRTDFWSPRGGERWFADVAAIFKKHGCKWGGDWVSPDTPHMQWGRCRPSPSDEALRLFAADGVAAVWRAVGADDRAVPVTTPVIAVDAPIPVLPATGATMARTPATTGSDRQLAWGGRVSDRFRARVGELCGTLAIDASDLMACMAFESGETFRPDVRNAAGSGAVGLIQFMPSTAIALGTTVDRLAEMTAEQQLDLVERYFAPRAGKLKNIGDVYMAILWPGAIGKPDDYALFDRADAQHPLRYRLNAGLDADRDGLVTRAEACAKICAKLAKGQRPENSWPI